MGSFFSLEKFVFIVLGCMVFGLSRILYRIRVLSISLGFRGKTIFINANSCFHSECQSHKWKMV